MDPQAQRWRIGGRVQGVGYRPFVFRLATSLDLTGWVRNTAGTVEIHAEGSSRHLQSFADALVSEAPPTALATSVERTSTPLESHAGFVILPSLTGPSYQVNLPVDLSPCADCLREMRDPLAHRFGYPFINCTQCGPRYTIIEDLPYDRCNTSLRHFTLCADCAREYSDPADRRFHAQPLACASCGPSLRWTDDANPDCDGSDALSCAVAALRAGRIIAVRGIGGYHLLCDAADENAVARLRIKKGRPTQPFAVLVPWAGESGLDDARRLAWVSAAEGAALSASSRPIVVLNCRPSAAIAASVAPGLREIGIMLPYSPLHHLLLDRFAAAVVATSGNISGEPVLTSPEEARSRLGPVAEGFLHHDRSIARPADDPVIRRMAGTMRPLRLGRGTAPLNLRLQRPLQFPLLAVGAHLKGTVALAWDARVVVSPHIGDYSTPRARAILDSVAADLQSLHGVQAAAIVHDAHPDFPSTRWAQRAGRRTIPIWHHHAHAAAVAGEFPGEAPMLCFIWDGVGLGADGTLWGGEALLGAPGTWIRVASFRPFRLPGGERAARQPWRSALSLCWATGDSWSEGEHRSGPLLRRAFDLGVNAPLTTSVGRLFDAAAALTGVCLESTFDAEAPMRLEALCGFHVPPVALPLARDASGIWRTDWAPLIPMLLDEVQPAGYRSARFHASLAATLCDQAVAIRSTCGVNRIGLAGGVFQNRHLTERAFQLATAAGFEVLVPRCLPLNDAAISYGQIVEAAALHAALP